MLFLVHWLPKLYSKTPAIFFVIFYILSLFLLSEFKFDHIKNIITMFLSGYIAIQMLRAKNPNFIFYYQNWVKSYWRKICGTGKFMGLTSIVLNISPPTHTTNANFEPHIQNTVISLSSEFCGRCACWWWDI